MPELPEAETIARGIRPLVSGRRIQDVEIVHADVVTGAPARLSRSVAGRRIATVGRRAKNVLLELDGGSVVWMNLGMTGGVLALPRPRSGEHARVRYGARATHPAVVFRLERGIDLVYDDSRRFGRIQVLTPAQSADRAARFGPEPLHASFTSDDLWRALRTSRAPVRSWLLDQRKISGIGNIYAAEALFRSGIHPARRAHTVRRHEAEALLASLRAVLTEAVQGGGTTIRDYRNALGRQGDFAPRLQVYAREGSPCTRCSTPIRRVVFGNRSAFLCPECQPRRARGRRNRRDRLP